jgi:hypothetical protein
MRVIGGNTVRALLSSMVMAIAFVRAVGAESNVQGDKGSWQSLWHGVGDSQKAAYALPRSCATIVKALDAAMNGDFPLFCSFFDGVDTNRASAEVKTWYDEWKAGTRQFIYLIGQEALLGSEPNRYAAVSIVPSALKDSAGKIDPSRAKADVIFARQTADGWKLLFEVVDRKLYQSMVERAAVFKYKPNEFSMEAIEEEIRQHHRTVLDQKRKQGASTPEVLSLAETFQVREAGVRITGWAEWTNHYRAEILDPPVVFDLRQDVAMDFSNPVSACRSYMRASYLRDRETLLKNADASEKASLRKRFEGDLESTKPRVPNPKLALVSILLTARTAVEGREYVMVFWRAQNAEGPKNDLVGFQKTFLVKNPETNSYLVTQDLKDSTLASILAVARAAETGLGKYSDIYNKMTKSSFPAHFYEIR